MALVETGKTRRRREATIASAAQASRRDARAAIGCGR